MGSKKKSKKPKKPAGAALDPATIRDMKAPKSMIFRRGKVGFNVINLIADLRKVMSPYTAESLKESKKNTLKDFASVAPSLGVTHFMCFNQSDRGVTCRMIRIPQGPTLTFRVEGYSLMRDVVQSQKRPHSPGVEFQNSPLLVLNNFSGKEEEKQLMSAMFIHMFPSIDVKNIKLAACRRVVLIHLDPETNLISFRHYVVTASPVGLTKSIKKIIKGKVPDLGNRKDIADYVMDPGQLSDSEVEDTPDTRVTLAQSLPGKGNVAKEKSAIRLKELGPRMTLSLIKIEQEMSGGQVLYHAHKSRTPEEIEALRARKAKEKKLKLQRKKAQEESVKKKKAQLNAAKRAKGIEVSDDDVEEPTAAVQNDEDIEDDDYQWYKQEVGAAPEAGLFGDFRTKRKHEAGEENKEGSHKRLTTDLTKMTRKERKKLFEKRNKGKKERPEKRPKIDEAIDEKTFEKKSSNKKSSFKK